MVARLNVLRSTTAPYGHSSWSTRGPSLEKREEREKPMTFIIVRLIQRSTVRGLDRGGITRKTK